MESPQSFEIAIECEQGTVSARYDTEGNGEWGLHWMDADKRRGKNTYTGDLHELPASTVDDILADAEAPTFEEAAPMSMETLETFLADPRVKITADELPHVKDTLVAIIPIVARHVHRISRQPTPGV